MHRPARPYEDSTESAQLPEMEPELSPVESVRQKLDKSIVASSASKVYLRLRPRVGGKPFTNPAFEPHSETTVASTTATLEHQQQKCFNFNMVFPEGSSQEQLFQGVVQDSLDAFIEGRNVLLFAHGPTASGKTHTMQGPCTDPGIVLRTLDRLFRLLGTQICQGAAVRPDCFDEVVQLSTTEEAAVLQLKNQLLGEKGARSAADCSTYHLPHNGSDASLFLSLSSSGSNDSAGQVLLWLSFYEINNERIYDLLLPSAEAPTKKAKGTCRTLLRLGEDHAKRFFIRGLIEVPIHTADEAHRLLCLAYHNRSIAETHLNRNSSCSHSVFTVRLVASGAGSQDWHVSSLMLCDLAGSEKPSKSGTNGSQLREAGRINTSLMVLSRCLEGLCRNKDAAKKVPVPFRDSKLTKVMQAYFTMGGQISLVVNICPSMAMFQESLNALKFSGIACQVVPLQLEPRHERCRKAVRRLTEVWSNARASTGEGDSFMAADSSAGPAILDRAETDELFDTVTALQQELDNTQKALRWNERMLSASRAEVTDYKNLVAEMEKTHELLRIADKEMATRIRNACEITRLDLYRTAEAGSTMEHLGRLEEAERRVAE
ncbi:LOW QUALITY PROTEIN: kinesin-like protein KIF20A [Amblyomma americanum]